MEPSDALTGLDLESVRRLKPRSGYTETISLTASYDFGFDAFATAEQGSRPARTILHETTHAYQMLATSYGHYYLGLRALQTSRVLAILRLLGEAGRELRPPLIRQIVVGRPASAWSQLRRELYVWFLAEMVLLYLEGDIDQFSSQLAVNPAVSGRSLRDLFADLEGYLAQWWRWRGHDVAAGPAIPDSEDAAGDDGLQLIFKLFSVGWGDTQSVLESGARITEYWRTWPMSLSELDASLPATYTAYTTWIKHARKRDLAADPKSFALTYAALADLALNPPLLPHHAALRKDGQPMRSLNPVFRLQAGMAVTGTGEGRVPPISDLARDYEGFVHDVCERNQWPTPTALAGAALRALPGDDIATDNLTSLYRLAQRFRLQVPYAFLDMDIWSIDGPAAKLFRQSFVHPVVQFKDRIFYHRDKAVVAEFVSSYALNQYLRQLMVTGNPPVALPFRATPEDLQLYTDLLSDVLCREADLNQPNIRLVADPAIADQCD